MKTAHQELKQGDLVRLKEPYQGRFGYGIVAEILSRTQGRLGGLPRNVSLHLYDSQGQLYIEPSYVERGLMVPQYVDFHVSELIWYRRATEQGYSVISNPPDWSDERYLK